MGGRGNWISVFLSERVLGRRRRRLTLLGIRQSAILRAVAGRFMGSFYRRAARRFARADGLARRLRLPLVNVLCGAAVAALAFALGVGSTWALAVFAIALVLTIAGQPARNLLGFAGVVIGSAALAEIVRQRERFFEIFMSFW